MIYLIGSRSFREFLLKSKIPLLKSKTPSRNWSWYKFWSKYVTRILPGEHDCRRSFLEIVFIRIWINLFEHILRKRHTQMELGFRKSFTYEETRIIYRGVTKGILRIHWKTSPVSASECSFSYVTLFMRFLGVNTDFHMNRMHILLQTFEKKPRTMSYQPLEYRLLLLHAALKTSPSYFQNKPSNSEICWSCLQASKCFHCSQCKVVRYCGLTCQKAIGTSINWSVYL